MAVSRFFVGLLLIASANAFWRLPCTKPVLDARVDPIVNPGKASGHTHTIMGSGGTPSRYISVKVNLIPHASHRVQYYICRLAQFGLHDVQG
jgi:Domain of unknown function (DUF1996)